MSDLDAFSFLLALREQSTPSACAALFRASIAPLGFDAFACGELDRRDRTRNTFYIIDWPDSWRRFYIGSGLIDRDPLIEALDHRRDPFTWSDLRADRKLSKVGRAALDLAAAEGWRDGLVVPLPQGGARIGLVSLVGRGAGLDQASRAYLVLISICLHTHVRALVSREGFAAPPVGLTDRELACLRLAARGMTDVGIAKDLGVATSTAHEFIEKAKRRFKVRSRTELVAVAVALGIVDI